VSFRVVGVGSTEIQQLISKQHQVRIHEIKNKINENFKTNKLFKLTAKININLKI
jgi:hypothetical protein